MRLLAVLPALLGLAMSEDIVCSKGLSKLVTMEEGDSFSFKTQEGAQYAGNTKCQVTYKTGSTCSSISFSCTKFELNSKRVNCVGGDKLSVKAGGKTKKYCQSSGPQVSSSDTLALLFTSTKKFHASGAECTAQCTQGSSSAYVAGGRGAAWDPQTVDIVKQKLNYILLKDDTIRDKTVTEEAFREKYFYESPNYPMPRQKIGISETFIRLAFHACLKYEDGSGGCNGCLDLDKYEIETNAQIPMGKNNGLQWAVAVLEALYLDKEFPRNTGFSGSRKVPDLKVSLKEMGASRADLWAFAGIVAIESFILKNNDDCQAGADSTWCEGVVNGNWTGCEFDLALTKANMKFETGRSDCVTSRHPAYLPEPEAVEIHPTVRGNGAETTTFFREEFSFTMRETVAIMGAHTIGKVHESISLIPYSWTREGTQLFNNEYYRTMARKKMYALDTCVGNALSQPGEGDFLIVLEGKGASLKPLNVTELTGKMSWFHTYLRCPDCKGLAMGNMVEANENRYNRLGGVEYCCGLDPAHPLPAGYECMPECVMPSRKDEAFSNSDMGLMFDFHYDAENQKFYGCPGFDNAADDDFAVGNIIREPDCPYNTMVTEEGGPIHSIVEEYAEDQERWAQDFGATFTRMLRNGYGSQGQMEPLDQGPSY